MVMWLCEQCAARICSYNVTAHAMGVSRMCGMPVMPRRPDGQQGVTLMDCLTEEQLADAPAHFFCPISLEVMVQPVRLATTGQVFDHRSLINWFRAGVTGCRSRAVHLRSCPAYFCRNACLPIAMTAGCCGVSIDA